MNIVQGEHKRVVFNLEKVDFVSSAGLRVIIRGAKMLQVHTPGGRRVSRC
jgi:anti-anti-sigma regulatory factor